MELRTVSDSSSDYIEDESVKIVPLKIRNDLHEFVDNAELDVIKMLETLAQDGLKTSSSCPSVGEYEEAYDGAKNVVAIAISSNMSGSYNAARVATDGFEGENIEVVDSLGAGPQLYLMIEKLKELKETCNTFDELIEKFNAYKTNTRLVFVLESLVNFVNNGRVSPIVAKAVNLLGIRMVARATDGQIDIIAKKKGAKRSYSAVIEEMATQGYKGGKVMIHHCLNEGAVEAITAKIHEQFPEAIVEAHPTRGLCSYYAEEKGFLVAYEI